MGTKILTLSVGSATNVWALSDINSVVGVEPLYFSNGSWNEALGFQGLGLKSISASSDGFAWAVTSDNSLYTSNAGSLWQLVTGETPPGPITAISAISRYRVNAVIAGTVNLFQTTRSSSCSLTASSTSRRSPSQRLRAGRRPPILISAKASA